jgi:protoporphyrinogen oxidase
MEMLSRISLLTGQLYYKRYEVVNYVVIGVGFRAMVAAYILVRKGHSVTIIGAGKKLGGVLSGFHRNEMTYDLGCHTFDNSDDWLTDIVIEMAGGGDAFSAIALKYNSLNDYSLSKDLSVFDATTLTNELNHPAIADFLKSKRFSQKPKNLEQKLENHFGNSAAAILRPVIERHFATKIDGLEASNLEFSIFSRIKLFDETITREIKKSNFFEHSIALPSLHSELMHYPKAKKRIFRNFYPSKGSMNNFCERVQKTLANMNVKFIFDAQINSVSNNKVSFGVKGQNPEELHFEKLVWCDRLEGLEKTLFRSTELENLVHSVPMSLLYIPFGQNNKTNVTYSHNFRKDNITARISAPNSYTISDSDNNNYLCCECPTAVDSYIWNSGFDELYTNVVREAIEMGMLCSPPDEKDGFKINAKQTFSLSKVGYGEAEQGILSILKANFSNIVVGSGLSTSKNTIIETLKRIL